MSAEGASRSAGLAVFIRLHARAGEEANVAAAIRDVIPPSRAEAGCIMIDGFAATGDVRLFTIHSRWIDEAAFDLHGTLAHTIAFKARVRELIDHPFEIVRTRLM